MRICHSTRSCLPLLALGASIVLNSLPLNRAIAAEVEIDLSGTGIQETGAVFKPTPWDGLYFGGHLGYQWTAVDVADRYSFAGDPAASASGSLNSNGLFGGVQIGYNFQKTSLVYGIEADLGYLNLSGGKSRALATGADHSLDASYLSESNLYGDVTVRGGVTVGKFLFYAKGGMALLNANFASNYTGQSSYCDGYFIWCLHHNTASSKFGFSDSALLWGWTAGAGVEYSLTPALSVKMEYQHFDFGSGSVPHNGSTTISGCYTDCTPSITGSTGFSTAIDTVKVGVNYYLNSGAH